MVDEICWRDADLVPIHIWRSFSAENDVGERVGNAIRYILGDHACPQPLFETGRPVGTAIHRCARAWRRLSFLRDTAIRRSMASIDAAENS